MCLLRFSFGFFALYVFVIVWVFDGVEARAVSQPPFPQMFSERRAFRSPGVARFFWSPPGGNVRKNCSVLNVSSLVGLPFLESCRSRRSIFSRALAGRRPLHESIFFFIGFDFSVSDVSYFPRPPGAIPRPLFQRDQVSP